MNGRIVGAKIFTELPFLHPPYGYQRKFSQLYVMNTSQALAEMLNCPKNKNRFF